MKVLQLYYKLPFPMNDGGAYAIYQSSLGLIGQHIDLKILAMDLLKSREKNIVIPEEFIATTTFESVKVNNRINPFKAFFNLFGRSSYFVARFESKKYATCLVKILKETHFDIIQLEHLYLGLYIDIIRKYSQAKIVLRAQNVENQLWANYLSKINNPFEKMFVSLATKRLTLFEKKTIKLVDGIVALSEEDAIYFKNENSKIPIIAVPVGININKFPINSNKNLHEESVVFYHLGSMDWRPNILGIQWFIKEVWPLIKKENPEIKFVIAGKNMPNWFFKQEDKNLIVHGSVDDSVVFAEDKNVLIVPLLAGSGIRVKILEAMALGKTVISTRIGASGIAYEADKNILLANTAEEFAKQISKCCACKQFLVAIGENARELIREKYSLEKTGEAMVEFYQTLIGINKKPTS